MATRDEIKKAILEVAGNPESGVVRQMADKWADAIVALDEPEKPAKKTESLPEKESRVTKPSEIR